MEKNKLKDPQTGEVFVPKRSNQKFATRKNQIKFNNEKQKVIRKENYHVNRNLANNKKILKTLLGDAEDVVKSKDYLLGAGYQFAYFTHTLRTGAQLVYCNYQYCIFFTENNNIKIYKND